jgi:hypothetical protein
MLAAALADDPESTAASYCAGSARRGKSDYDRNPANYNLNSRLADHCRAHGARDRSGGIRELARSLAMLLACGATTAIAGCVLNDIGGDRAQGPHAIKSYVGKMPQPASFHEAADIPRLFGGQFPKLNDDDWVAFARRTLAKLAGESFPITT